MTGARFLFGAATIFLLASIAVRTSGEKHVVTAPQSSAEAQTNPQPLPQSGTGGMDTAGAPGLPASVLRLRLDAHPELSSPQRTRSVRRVSKQSGHRRHAKATAHAHRKVTRHSPRSKSHIANRHGFVHISVRRESEVPRRAVRGPPGGQPAVEQGRQLTSGALPVPVGKIAA